MNEEKRTNYEDFSLIDAINLKYNATIQGNETIKNLFTMTPYYHRTSLEDKEKLESVETLFTTIEVNYLIYKKND